MINALSLAVQFLTRLPVPSSHQAPTPEVQGQSVLFYPLVGLLIGLLLLLVQWLLGDMAPSLQAALILTLWVLITGALHLDGLADLADAWIGGQGDRERTLTIMKDTHSGPIAVTALVLLLLIKFAALETLLEGELLMALLLVPMMARAALVASLRYMPYARPDGLGSTLSEYLHPQLGRNVIIASALFVVLLLGWNALIPLAGVAFVFMLLRHLLMDRLGGITGDSAGAICEITEATALVALVFIL